MKRILLFVIMQLVCIVTEIGAVAVIPSFTLQIWILLIIASIIVIYFAYKHQKMHSRFAIKIVVTEIIALAVWIGGALLLIDLCDITAISPEDSIFRGVVLFIFAPILSLWSTGWWAFLKLWPFNDIDIVRYLRRHS
jgi:hypothetical protein